MTRKFLASHWGKCCLLAGTMVFGILPSGCETAILRIATPFLI